MNERQIILEALLLIEKGEDYGNKIIKDVLDKYVYLGRQQRSFIKRVLEGTIERRIELDYIIDQFSKTPTVSMKPVILCVLRMGVYQLKYMNKIPVSAVCNEAVRLAEKKGFYQLKGFVNGVLRNIARNIDGIKYPKRPEGLFSVNLFDAVRYLSVTYSMPEFLVKLFIENYGNEAEDILKAFFRDNITTIRLNESKADEETLKRVLAEDDAKIIKLPGIFDMCNNAYILEDYDMLSDLKAFKMGLFQVQDQSAMLPVEMADIKISDTVFDVCAAPGGKTVQAVDVLCKLISQTFKISHCNDGNLNNDELYSDEYGNNVSDNKQCCGDVGRVFSFDVSGAKVERILENLERCDFAKAVEVAVDVRDATTYKETYVNQADVIIADLPCSGLGIIGRKSDIKYNISEDGIKSLVKLQQDILKNVVNYLKTGGTLMYSTCTLNPMENEKQVEWMEENLGLKCEEMHRVMPSNVRDGFFVARMCKGESC